MSEFLGSCEGKSITSGRTNRRAGLRICRLLKMDGFLRLKGNGIAEKKSYEVPETPLKTGSDIDHNPSKFQSAKLSQFSPGPSPLSRINSLA